MTELPASTRRSWRRFREEPRKRLITTAAGWAAAEVEAALTVPADPGAAAFFDVDNTMMQGASIYYLARGLAARKYFTTGDLVRFAWQQLKFRVLAAEHGGDVSQAREAALAFVAGWRVDELRAARRGDLRRADGRPDLVGHARAGPPAPRRRPAGLAGHRRARGAGPRSSRSGSGSPARSARWPRSRDGVYTGRLVGDMLHGPAKAEAITALAAAEGLDLARCAAYSDSVNDMPDALARRARGGRQPRLARCAARPAARLGDPRLPHRPQGRQGGGSGGAGHRRTGRRRRGRVRVAPAAP